MKIKIVIFEAAMLFGVCVAAFEVPGNFPLKWFISISIAVLVMLNLILFSVLRRKAIPPRSSSGTNRALNWALCLLAFCWLLEFLFKRLR